MRERLSSSYMTYPYVVNTAPHLLDSRRDRGCEHWRAGPMMYAVNTAHLPDSRKGRGCEHWRAGPCWRWPCRGGSRRWHTAPPLPCSQSGRMSTSPALPTAALQQVINIGVDWFNTGDYVYFIIVTIEIMCWTQVDTYEFKFTDPDPAFPIRPSAFFHQ